MTRIKDSLQDREEMMIERCLMRSNRVTRLMAVDDDGVEDSWEDREGCMARDFSWMDQARCKEIGAEFFFPSKGGAESGVYRVCQGCEVREECEEWAGADGYGVWAGEGVWARQRRLRSLGGGWSKSDSAKLDEEILRGRRLRDGSG